jgi:SpoVK/Ycf46/Vps4 family AAA+-type ATPase
MATNRSYDLDEAMHRRITLAIEFRTPDPDLRQEIWKAHFPKTANLKLAEDINWHHLAVRYELTGGFIKNAILSALSAAVSRDANNVVITQEDLEKGANHQLRGRLAMIDFDRRVVPKRGLEDLVITNEVRQKLEDIISFEKARTVLFSAWGYDEKVCSLISHFFTHFFYLL